MADSRNIKHLTPSEYHQIIPVRNNNSSYYSALERLLISEGFSEQARILLMYVNIMAGGWSDMDDIITRMGGPAKLQETYGPEFEEYLMRSSSGDGDISHGIVLDLSWEKMISREFRHCDNKNGVPTLKDIEELFAVFSPDSTYGSQIAHIEGLFARGNLAALRFALRVFSCAAHVEAILPKYKRYANDLYISLKYNKLADLPPYVVN